MLLGLESKGVQVDTCNGPGLEMLKGLDQVEVGTLAGREAVMTVQLELDGIDDTITLIILQQAILVVISSRLSDETTVLTILVLDDPSEVLHGMVQVQTNVELRSSGARSNGLGTSVLELSDQVLVTRLCIPEHFFDTRIMYFY